MTPPAPFGESRADPLLMARAAGCLYGIGAGLVLLTLALPGPDERAGLAMLLIGLVAGAISAAILALGERVPLWGFDLLVALGTCLITLLLLLNGTDSSLYAPFYFFAAIFAFYFVSVGRAGLQLVLIGAAYGAFLLLRAPTSDSVVHWVMLLSTLLVSGVLVAVLRQRLESLLHVERGQVEFLRGVDRVKDNFVATVSHELRTPLTSICGYLELLLEDDWADLSERQRHYLGIADRNSKRLLRLVGDLLLLTEIDADGLLLDRDEVEIAAVARDGVTSARPLALERGIDLSFDGRQCPPIRGDAGRLSQVVDNLIANALKFTPKGGRVEVRADQLDGHALIEVADTGVGIPAEEQERLFERFFRGSRVHEQAIGGTGLGLSIAQAIVTAHRGTLSFQSAEGAGTTFRVSLPIPSAELLSATG